MSKIHQALEKAARERGSESSKVPPSPEGTSGKGETPQPIIRQEGWTQVGKVTDSRLIAFFQPRSLGGEQFRKLRTHLFSLSKENPPRTIMVTSAVPDEGKTMVTANLAAGIAYDFQAYALLVDCDFGNSTLSRWFGMELRSGLSDYLMGNGDIPSLLVKTEVDKLSLLTSGNAPENPTELMGSRRMENLVTELKSRYRDRYIIFDTTPLLATSEAEVLGKLVDGILVVVRAGRTPRETLKQAIAPLDKRKILGFVLNHVEFKSSALFSRYFGSDGYYYRKKK